MPFYGELLSLLVAILWTVTALFGGEASKRLGPQVVNLMRMILSMLFIGLMLWIAVGVPWPRYADSRTWLLLALSGLVGFVFGDFCLFNAYVVIGARFGQLFMTIAPPVAAALGWMFLGEKMAPISWLAMLVTLSGIALSILGKDGGEGRVTLRLPLKGVLLGIGAGLGQGGGLVLSKLGINAYTACLPADAPAAIDAVLPFASTMIRVIAGAVGFLVLLLLAGEGRQFGAALHNGKGMLFVVLTTFFGPFVGVSLSLLAVQHASAGIASTLMALTPVLIILPYSLIYKQKVSVKELIGLALAMAGVALFFLL